VLTSSAVLRGRQEQKYCSLTTRCSGLATLAAELDIVRRTDTRSISGESRAKSHRRRNRNGLGRRNPHRPASSFTTTACTRWCLRGRSIHSSHLWSASSCGRRVLLFQETVRITLGPESSVSSRTVGPHDHPAESPVALRAFAFARHCRSCPYHTSQGRAPNNALQRTRYARR
jgi:hypothetical protein